MPIYKYECRACGEVFSVLKLGASEVDTIYPKRHSIDTRKKVSSFCSMPLMPQCFSHSFF